MRSNTTYTVMAERITSPYFSSHILQEIILAFTGSLLLAAFAQLAVFIPGSPVPITAQVFGVLLIGMSFGSKRAFFTVIAYLLEGAAGLPVFSAGAAGAAHLFGATGGYLWGFAISAYVLGLLAERGWDRNVFTSVAAMTIGTAVIFACGLAWLSVFTGFSQSLYLGLYPYLPGAVIKITIAAGVLPLAWKLVKSGKKA